MKLHQKLIAQLRALTDADNEALPRWQRALLYAIDLGRLGATKLREDRASQMAAALTYHTLFSLLPTLVLTLVVAQAFISQEQLNDLKSQAVTWVVGWLETDEAVVTEPAPRDAPTTPPRAGGFSGLISRTAETAQQAAEHYAADQRRAEYVGTIDKLDDQFQLWLDQLQRVSFGSIGVVGLVIFIYGATKLLSTIESSFNFILRATEHRSWYVRLPLYYTTITLAPVVLIAGQWAQRRLMLLLDSGGSVTAWVVAPLGYLSPLLTTWLVLLLAYRLLPNATLRVRPAAIGSFVAAVLLGLAVQGFALYVRSTGTTSLYGALALLPLFLLLLWIIWQIVLFGLELAVVLQMLPGQRPRRGQQPEHPVMPDPRLLIPAMAIVGERFGHGESTSPEHIAERLTLPNDATATMIDALIDNGHLHPVEGESRAYTLARPPEKIAVTELLDLARHLGQGGPRESVYGLQALDGAAHTQATGQTLADLVG